MTEIIAPPPKQSVLIQGAVAPALIGLFPKAFSPQTFAKVETPEEIAKAKDYREEGDEHHCPFCKQYYNWADLKAHAQGCINAHAPAWERQLDEEPRHNSIIQFRPKVFGPTGRR